MRFHKGKDGWGRDSYQIPQYAVVGSSDTGMWSDSPAPSDKVKNELDDFRTVLRKNKIRSRIGVTKSGNVMMVKVWVVVNKIDFERANKIAREYLELNETCTRYIHNAE